MQATHTHLLYALTEPDTGEIRYIGQTRGTLKQRLGNHCCGKRKCYTTSWIAGLRERGSRPAIELLAIAVSQEQADLLEQGFIARLKEQGWNLTNHHEGGQGHRIFSQATCEKIAAASRGRKVSSETRAKVSASLMGNTRSVGRVSPHSPETRAKISEAHKGIPLGDEHRARLSESHKGKPWSEAQRAAAAGRTTSAETRQQMAESQKARRRKEQEACPDSVALFRVKMSEVARAREARRAADRRALAALLPRIAAR